MSNKIEDFEKYSYEEFTIYAQFHRKGLVAISDSIVLGSSSVSAVDSDDVDATDTVLTASTLAVVDSTVVGTDNTLAVWVKAGTVAGSTYIITFKAVTAAGNKLKKIVKMKIKSEEN